MTQPYLNALEEELRAVVNSARLPLHGSPLYSQLINMLGYHLGWFDASGRPAPFDGGKRLRGLICLYSCEAVGGDWEEAIAAAAAIELLHNFSLIHDDIQDNSQERRSRAAIWKVWGVPQGINAGDAMFALARIALDRIDRRLALSTWIDVNQLYDAATLALMQGQFLDLCNESRIELTIGDYLEMVRGKTAALISAGAAIGARIGDDNQEVVAAFARYGENLGIAFQIVDDVLGIWGAPEITGKSATTDLFARKKSLPLLLALQQDSDGRIRDFLSKTTVTEGDVAMISALLDGLDTRSRAMEQAETYLTQALSAVEGSGVTAERTARLRELALNAVRRDK